MSQQSSATWLEQLEEIAVVDGETDVRMQVLLWLARAVFEQEDLDSYDAVFTSRLLLESEGLETWIDGVAHHSLGDVVEHVVFVWVGEGMTRDRDIRNAELVGGLHRSDSAALEEAIARSAAGPRMTTELRRVRRDARAWSWKVAAVTPTVWNGDGARIAEAGIDPWDSQRMASIAAAQRDPSLLNKTLTINAKEYERLATRAGGRRVYVAPVRGREIAKWPGIDDRRLFDLNVRFSLGGSTRVRKSLNEAFLRPDQSDFLALHNGLTVICDEIREYPSHLEISDVSVVNGAQSVIALFENENRIADNLTVLVKFVETGDDDELAREIAVRSNTQNPVTGRNLRALDESQIRMAQALSRRQYVLDTRPDASRIPSPQTIKNDDAAQWICAVYLEKPWLAVKRTELFAPGIFQEIFSESRTPEQLILLNTLREVIDVRQRAFPESMRRAWLLTRLTAMYLCGQVLRFDEDYEQLLLAPVAPEGDSQETRDRLAPVVSFVADYLVQRQNLTLHSEEPDDFRVEFKRQRSLLEMSAEATKAWRLNKRSRGA